MEEHIIGNIISILIIAIPVAAYFCFSRILSVSFTKTPDDPSFQEKKEDIVPIRILKVLIRTAVIIAVIVGGLHLLAGIFSNSTEKANRYEQEAVAEYEELNEDNVDPETGKTILTKAFLRKEYKLYASNENWNKGRMPVLYKFVLVITVLIAGGWSCIYYVYGFYKMKRKINVPSIVFSVLLIPTFLIGFKVIDKTFVTNDLPDPDKAEVSAAAVVIKSRHDRSSYDEDNGYRYEYFLDIDYGDGEGTVTREVPYGMYATVEEPGTYFMGQAEENGKKCDFRIYSPKEYEAES